MATPEATKMRLGGYYMGRVSVDLVDPNLFSHLFFYTYIDEYNKIMMPRGSYGAELTRKSVDQMKATNPALKIFLSIDAHVDQPKRYCGYLGNEAWRQSFSDSILNILNVLDFDGVDLYCVNRTSNQENMKLLLDCLKPKLGTKYLLSIAMNANIIFLKTLHNVPEIFKYVDLINLFAIDMQWGYDLKTRSRSALSSHDSNNLIVQLKGWIEAGVDAHKINLVITAVAKTFVLTNRLLNFIGAPCDKIGHDLDYRDLLTVQKQPDWTVMWSESQKAPYMFNDNLWVSYEDSNSIGRKVDFLKSFGANGVTVWTLDADDVQGDHGETFSFTKKIKKAME